MVGRDPGRTGSAPPGPRASQIVARVLALAERRKSSDARSHLLLYAIGAAGLVVGLAASATQLPEEAELQAPMAFIGACGLAVLSYLLNAVEYRSISRWSGADRGYVGSLKVTLLATAANALPIPGAAIVRVQALRGTGVGSRQAISLVAYAVAVLVSIALTAAGALALVTTDLAWPAPVLVLVTGASGLALSTILPATSLDRTRLPRVVATMILLEAGSVALMAVRAHLVFHGLGLDPPAAASMSVALAGVLSTLIGVVPGGLGVREGLAGLLAAVVGTAAAAGVVAAAIDRLVGYLALLLLALVVIGGSRARHRARRSTLVQQAEQVGSEQH